MPNLLLAALNVLVPAAFLGFWVKEKQLSIVSAQLSNLYPTIYWAHSVLVVSIFCFLVWLFCNCLFKVVFGVAASKRGMLISSFSYWALLLVYLNATIAQSVGLVFLLQFVSMIKISRFDFQKAWSRIRLHLFALFCIAFSQFAFNGFLSPLTWDNPLAALNKVESKYLGIMPVYQQSYLGAKNFDFSEFLSAYWGGFPSAVSGESHVVGLVSLIGDFPAIDLESFQRMVLQLFFALAILGSFGFYLFVLYGLQLSAIVATIGGVLYLISNRFLAVMLTQNFPIFSAVFLLLPYPLLFVSMAFKKKSLGFAWLAGSAFSLSFYFITSHPDAVYQGAAFLLMQIACLAFLYKREVSLKMQLALCLTVGISMALTAAFAIGPLVETSYLKEGAVFGHIGNVHMWLDFKTCFRTCFIPILKTFGIFLAALLLNLKQVTKNKEKRRGFLCFSAIFWVLSFLFILGTNGPFIMLLDLFKVIKFNFVRVERVWMYLSLSGLILSLYGAEEFLKSMKGLKLWVLTSLSVLLFFLLVYWKFNLCFSLILWCVPLLVVLALFYRLSTRGHERRIVPLVGVLSAVAVALLFESSFEWQSPKLIENAKNCKPYITLQALLIKSEAVPADINASLKVIRKRLLAFESDIQLALKQRLPINTEKYFEMLKKEGVEQASSISEKRLIKFSESVSSTVDDFYQGEFACHYIPFEKSDSDLPWKNFPYNNAFLFQNGGSRFQRLMSLTGSDFSCEMPEGQFAIDYTAFFEPRYMTAFPPLNALYVLPNPFLVEQVNSSLLDWHKRELEVITDPLTRKMMNISGVDAYVVNNSKLQSLDPVPDLKLNKNLMPRIGSSPFSRVEDQRSFGIAFLAKQVRYTAPQTGHIRKYKPPFTAENNQEFEIYKQSVDSLQKQLMQLKGKDSVIIERDDFSEGTKEYSLFNNQMQIINIVGNKATFDVNCEAPQCMLVFNYAALSGWRAFSDKKPVPIHQANFAFMGVEVPHGKHLVWFELLRFGAIFGVYSTMVGYLIAAVWFLFFSKGSHPMTKE